MRFSLLAVAAFVFAAVLGCTATGPTFTAAPPPSSDQTLVYIYRVPNFAGSASNVSFAIEGKPIAALYGEGYTRFYVKSGYRAMTVSFSLASFPEQHRALHFRPGTTMYLRTSMGGGGAGPGIMMGYRVQEVSAEIGGREISSYKFQAPEQDLF
jgi:hypothetical protein